MTRIKLLTTFFLLFHGTCLLSQTLLINESFEGSAPPTGWTYNSISHSTNQHYDGNRSARFNSTNDYLITPLLTYPEEISFWLYKVPGSDPNVTIEWHTSPNPGTWNTLETINGTNGTWVQYTTNVLTNPGFTTKQNIYLRIAKTGGNKDIYIDLFQVTSPPPTPDFSANPLNVYVNDPVTFSDLSTGNITGWEWNFGDGATPATASSQGPHTVSYSTPGTKTISLTLNGSYTETKTNLINVTGINTATATYSSGDLPTDYGFQSLPGASTCPGVLVVNIPPGSTIVGVDVTYTMIARNWGWMSEQVSLLKCTSPGGTAESMLSFGSGNNGGSMDYTRTNLDIANGVTGGGNIIFELHAGRTWGGGGCNTTYNYVDNNSWSIRVYYHTGSIPDFVASTTAPAVGQMVTFTDLSQGNVISWEWDFGADATPATANTQGPHQVSYSTSGPKTVSLTINNNLTETKVNYILVDDWLHWDDGTNVTSVGRTSQGVFQLASRFIPADLSGFSSHSITHIRIYIRDLPSSASIKIWQGANQLTLAEVVSQTFTPVADSWNTIALSQPYFIDPNQELWFGAELDDPGFSFYPGAVDATTEIDGQSNLVRININDPNAWITLTSAGINGDWNVQAFLVPSTTIWTGALSQQWHNSGNWSTFNVPSPSSNVIIPTTPNDPLISTDVEINRINIESGATLTIQPQGTLTVNNSLVNQSGNNGLLILSDNDHSGSLMHQTDAVPATYQRYIKGDPEAWHTLSSPVSGQDISGVFTPTGGTGAYGDGTRYDLYIWNEPDTSWVYHLNTTVPPTWSNAHPGNSFIPAKGYLAAYLDPNPTLPFAGNLNNGPVSINITRTASTSPEFGAILAGNPYPSSIDWKSPAGWTRSDLETSGGGYDIWIWNDTAYNYGVYNSASPLDQGTLGITRYIPPAQGFFVKAAQNGTLAMTNEVRTHQGSANWLKTDKFGGIIQLSLQSLMKGGSDEIMLLFDADTLLKGTQKRFSFMAGAPALYLPDQEKSWSMRWLTTPADYPVIPISVFCGTEGKYTINANFRPEEYEIIHLIDLLKGKTHDLKSNPTYIFYGTPNDDQGRFVLQLVPGLYANPHESLPARLYSSGQQLYIDLKLLSPKNQYTIHVFNLAGQSVYRTTLPGGNLFTVPFTHLQGIYVAKIQGKEGILTQKVHF